MKWVTVSNMYNQLEPDEKLLSSFNAEFWYNYTENHEIYDRRFKRMFSSFRFFEQIPVEFREPTIAEIKAVKDSFIEAVYEHLLINSKKYSELYRINVVPDTDYSIIDNYNVTEIMDRDTTKTDSDVYGSHTDSETETVGQKTNTISDSIGAREDSNTTTIGEQNNTATNTIAGFNSDDFENDRQVDDSIGERVDESVTNVGAQSNSRSEVLGQQSNSTSTQYGSKTDSHTGSGTEDYVLTKKGNIGVKTATEVMNEHKRFWDIWEFYSYIFKEICADLLLI